MCNFVKFFIIVVHCTLISLVECAIVVSQNDRNSIKTPCQYPEVISTFFDDEHVASKQPPELHIINSTAQNLNTGNIFPYQYILLSCSASYPVEWIGNVPQHYYFSYILDDEVRSQEKFTVRLHIGNETFSKIVSGNVGVACSPVHSNDSCGTTLASVNKFVDRLRGNKTMLQIQFLHKDNMKNDELIVQDPQLTNSTECNSNRPWEYDFQNLYSFRELASCAADGIDLTPPEISQTSLTPSPSPNGKCNVSKTPASNLSMEADSFLSLCVQNASTSSNDIYVGDTVAVTCISHIYFFAQGMQIKLVQKNGTNDHNEDGDERDIGKLQREQAFGPSGCRNIITSFTVENNKTQIVNCSAPVRKNRRWVSKTVLFTPKVPVKVFFHRTPENAQHDASGTAYLTCNASGYPLPGLVWSRLNNEKLPSNQTIETGHAGQYNNNSSSGNASFSSSSSLWISSKLSFPATSSADNLTEYYGRYICTAKNKFDSIEQVFLIDEKGGLEETSIFTGKAVWFWGIVAASISLLLVLVLWLVWLLRKQMYNLRLFSRAEINDFMFGKPELLLENTDDYEEMNTYAAYLPYDKHQFEIQREQFDFDPKDILGSGAFGTVYKGVLKCGYGRLETVAIKTVNPSSDKMYFAALLSEIKIMCYIGKHANVVSFLGACTKYLYQRQIFVATEYCPNGDLLSYILKHQSNFKNNSFENQSLAGKPASNNGGNGYSKLTFANLLLSPHLLLEWALQIAQGMSYLSSKKVIHGDLAARNVLLSGDLQPKIADFGLSKQLQKYANYVQKGDELVPWRWLAVESLQFMKFSVQSDVWAFGVVLYELFSLGQVPYGNHTYSELFIVSLCQGERLHQPPFASDQVYSLMQSCWKHAPENRPSFLSVANELQIMVLESETKMRAKSASTATPIRSSAEHVENDTVKLHISVENAQEKQTTKSPHRTRNENVPVVAKSGYVTEKVVSPTAAAVAAAVEPIQSDKRYVDHGLMDIELLAPPSSTMQVNAAYVDWNAASA